MKPILILLSPAFGHYHATYKLATQLKERGYPVVYAGESTYRKSVESLGFSFREFPFSDLVRDRYGKMRYFQLSVIPYFFSNLFQKGNRNLYRDYAAASTAAKEVIASIDPELILLDIHISTLYLLLIQTGKPCFLICTTLSTNRAPMIPPINSGFVPEKTIASKCFTALLWFRQSLQNRIDYLFQKVIYAGNDNDSHLRKYARESGIQPGNFLNRKILKTSQIPIRELIFAPDAFDYPWRTEQPNVSYIGPSVLMERADHWDNAISDLLETLKGGREKHQFTNIVYCSLGTINYWQNKNCFQFFKKVITAFGNKSGWFVIMAIGKDIPPGDLGSVPDNIKVFSVVPQISVLSACDAMITHGGFNTMKECILTAVPMVVYPLSDLWDQHGNAARVVYHKIGLRGQLEKDSSEKIFSDVNRLFQEPHFKTNVTAMREYFQQLNDAATGADEIDSFIKAKAETVAV